MLRNLTLNELLMEVKMMVIIIIIIITAVVQWLKRLTADSKVAAVAF